MDKKVDLKDRLQTALNIREKRPADLVKDLGIPKSAISQYLSGSRTIKDSKRLYAMAKYLNVSEAWLMGFDVAMERPIEQTNSDILVDITVRLKTDSDFLSVVKTINSLDTEKFKSVQQMLAAFTK